MIRSQFRTSMFGLSLIGIAALILPSPTLANDSPPSAPSIDCTKPSNKNKPACKDQHKPLSNDEIYNAAYWLAHDGQYKEALAVLSQAKTPNDPRILNETGFVTRKLGNVDAALPYYRQALAINPDYTLAREYMGEAFVTKGDLASAREQLGEIERRRGRDCVEYAKLSEAIARAEKTRALDG
jgi:tetratricopeptide (TPR) repeat protein